MINPEILHPELQFQTARSGGKGGQNVNKVETKVELRFDVANSALLSEEEKAILLEKLTNKLTNEGILVLYHQTERSQLANKDKVIEKFNALIKKSFEKPKPRKASKPTAASKEKRLQTKQRDAEVKAMRRKITE
ncbi:alternative ribosome rescue aminoacyl-tRNA hydrolase ArfB [Runella sp.]|uniref:alternative ribosome rescue aminoacyl-tRNA hydrolase ArfB n=1 Tax=Runella sp. TaxID=1960881 RepID=UPI003D13D4A6